MKKEIAFSIHPSSGSLLVIQIDNKHQKGSQQNRKIYWDMLLPLASKGDLASLEMLREEKSRYLRNLGRRESLETADFSRVQIDAKRSIPVLKELATTEKLYFNRKQLKTDFTKGVELHYLIEKDRGGRSIIRGIIKTSSEEYDLTECDLICKGDPHWFIKDGSLHVFKGDPAWKWIRKAFEKKPFLLNSSAAEGFTEEISGEIDTPPDPTPVLALTDRVGAFANLLMDYGEDRRIHLDDPSEKWRKVEAEAAFVQDLLEAGYIEKREGSSRFYCPVDKIAESLKLLIEIGWEVYDHNGNRVVTQTDLNLSLQSGTETILATGKVKYDTLEAPISSVVGAINNHEPFINLTPGTVGLISRNMLEKNMSGLFDGEICSGGIKVSKHNLATLQELFDSDVDISSDQHLQKLRDRLKTTSLGKAPPGKGFQGTLRGYQEEGVAWLSFLHEYGLHGILADDMGLGKTVQVLAFLSRLEIKTPVLIVMPRSLLFHWKREIERFLPALSAYVHHGTDRTTSPELKKHEIILTSYSTLRGDIEIFQEISFSCVFLDEAQVIKNPKTQAAKAVCRLTSQFRLSVTGTPIENHIGELLSQFRFLIPGLFKGQLPPEYDSSLMKQIKKKVHPFILRRKKEEVDEQLPEKIEQVVWLEMNPEQRQVYEEFLSCIKKRVLKKVSHDGVSKHRMEIFEAILRLRQICCHPLLLGAALDAETPPSTKCNALLLDLETILDEGKKALVFSQFTSMLSIIKQQCRERGWEFVYLDGATKDREQVVQRFQEDKETQLFFISLKAGGVGLNLTAADYVFIFDPWWNEAVENQAIDRAHRIGRHDPVIAKRYIMRNSIEEKMMTLKHSKQAIAKDLFEEHQNLNMEDLEFLLL